jgi:hypothetical protein
MQGALLLGTAQGLLRNHQIPCNVTFFYTYCEVLVTMTHAGRVQVRCQLGPAAPAMHWPRHGRETFKTPAV